MALSHPTIIDHIDYGNLCLVKVGGVMAVTSALRIEFTGLTPVDCETLPEFSHRDDIRFDLSPTSYTTFWPVISDEFIFLKLTLRNLKLPLRK